MGGVDDNGTLSSDMADDAEIIEAVLAGNVNRYGELVDRYQLPAWRLAFSLVGDLEEARDLSQNGFIKAYRNLGRFRGKSRFSTWLYRIVVNECRDFLRKKSRQPAWIPFLHRDPESGEEILFDPADPSEGPRDLLESKDLAGRISEAIGRLPMKQKIAFVLCHLQGISLQEASETMGVRLGTVKAHLFRATETLRAWLEPFIKEEGSR